MKVLVIGSGGREHALAWKLAQSPKVTRVLVAPGNPGTAAEKLLQNAPITDIAVLVELAKREQVAFTVVGPEAPLAAGVVDAFRAAGLPMELMLSTDAYYFGLLPVTLEVVSGQGVGDQLRLAAPGRCRHGTAGNRAQVDFSGAHGQPTQIPGPPVP
mgnify:CR=1 FL=1